MAMIEARLLRYRFLPLLFTLLVQSATNGAMVTRPLHFEFPKDPLVHEYTTQFMLGGGLMVVPQTKNKHHVATARNGTRIYSPVPVYFPAGIWYTALSGQPIQSLGRVILVPDTASFQPKLFLRGGFVLVTQDKWRSLQITVALDANGTAQGEYIGAPNKSIAGGAIPSGNYTHFHFIYTMKVLTGYCRPCAHSRNMSSVVIFGFPNSPTRVTFNAQGVKHFHFAKQVLTVPDLAFALTRPFVLRLS